MAIPNPNPNIADGIKCDNKTYSSNKIESLISTATELPIPEAGDAGKVLTVDEDLDYELAAIPAELPTPATGDAGKVLTVNAGEDGYELTTPVDPTSIIDNSAASADTVYSSSKVADLLDDIDDKLDYSTSENAVGTWIDGKTIYRKVVNLGTLGNAAATTVQLWEDDYCDQMISIKGFASNAGGVTLPLPYAYPTATSPISLIYNKLDSTYWGITCTTGSDRTEFTGTLILEYTKV